MDSKFKYPQALVKQLVHTDMEWSETDVHVLINSDTMSGTPENRIIWFPSDKHPIQPHQSDLTVVLLHEYMHGLGIVSHFREFSNNHHHLENVLFPFLPFWKFVFHDQNVMENMTLYHSNSTLTSPPTIFDKYIRVNPTNEYFYELYNEINDVFGDLLAQNATKEKLYDLLAEHPILEKARKAYQLATTKSSLYWMAPIPSEDTWFKYNTSGLMIPQIELKVELETTITNPEYQDSAITHLSHLTFKETNDFLMVPYSISGKKLNDLGDAGQSPIGPYLTRMLDVMGYEIKFGKGDLSRMYMPGTSFVRNLTLILSPFLFICLYLFHSKMKRKTGIQS